MKHLLILILMSSAIYAYGDQAGFDEVKGTRVRKTLHQDGSESTFTRSPDARTLTKVTHSANGTIMMRTVYRMDAQGNPMNCKIYNGQNDELFKSRYGYRKSDGKLVEEQMFDSRVKHIDPNTGGEMPVRRFIYTYDAHGNRSAPISYTLIAGKTAEEVFSKPTAPDSNLFNPPPGR